MASMTSLLPPITAVRIAWARTGAFSNDTSSQKYASMVEASLKDIKAEAEKNKTEKKYTLNAIAAIDTSLRSLEIVHKGRDLNFEDNEKLRLAYLQSVEESIVFGKQLKDFLKSLPAIAIGAGGGVTLADALNLSGITLWGIGSGLAGIGYFAYLGIASRARKKKQMLYVREDYERGRYYDKYLDQVELILNSLYLDVDRIHKNIFEDSYPTERNVADIIEDLLKGVRRDICPYAEKHISERKITPEVWPLCETADEGAVEKCEHWEGAKA
ncbi:MAG: hypothetical protein GTO29_13295 [Candidatus Latescibacteria bacterium]|nr:hypothetical protein [Candidatus Latescibacterota bacterium]NIO57226.1 hypothetical protein [Candidatus Latescibacterota bacterium]